MYVGITVIVNPQRLQGQSHITKPTNIEMLIKLLYCILIPVIKGNPYGGLVNMYNDWHESLLFIFYERKFDLEAPHKDIFQNPDCFAYKLSPSYAFTTSSCFMNLEKISKMLENHETHERIMDRIFSRKDMKLSQVEYLKKFDVIEVIAKYFT